MFDALIRFSLHRRWLVLLIAAVVLAAGIVSTPRMPVDVLPRLDAPTVTVVTEAEGLAPEEVERQVTIPIENAVAGIPGLRRTRSSSGVGISVVWVELDWDADAMDARQLVQERLSVARASMPEYVRPELAPASSIMGDIAFVGVVAEGDTHARDVRDVADWTVRRRLLAVPGVAQVITIGGELRQYEIVLDVDALARHELTSDDVSEALGHFGRGTSGGFVVSGKREYVVRAAGRVRNKQQIEQIAVGRHDDVVVRIADVARVRTGSAIRRGDGGVDGRSAVVLKIQKQTHANTLAVTQRIDETLDRLEPTLPDGVKLYRKGFRQADFIGVAVDNVTTVLRDAAILVAIVLVLFLGSWRTTLISLVALPLSLVAALLVLSWLGASINTMTLGGLAIAVGELVDDAIIDVENIHRRLRLNAALPEPEREAPLAVVLAASREVRSSVVFATAMVTVAFVPLFFMEGLEGRLLAPLGTAYVVALSASLLVALTITPALSYWLLARGGAGVVAEGRIARGLKRGYRPLVRLALRAPLPIGVLSLAGAVAAVIALFSFGRTFLPSFNEGAVNITAATEPGTSLEQSVLTARRLEQALLDHPAVTSVVRITGRGERDEHALDVNFSELEVGLDTTGRSREQVFREVRERATAVPGLAIDVGQPISHRIDHVLSGSRSSLVVRVVGDDLALLRSAAQRAGAALGGVGGLADVNVEQITEVPQIGIEPRAVELAQLGRNPGDLARYVSMATVGEPVAQWWSGDMAHDVVLRLPRAAGESLEALRAMPVDGPAGRFVRLGGVAEVHTTLGPNLVNRENGQRRVLVTANVPGGDPVGAAERVREQLKSVKAGEGAHFELGGQFESEARARTRVLWLSLGAVLAMAALLVVALGTIRKALVVLVNLPLALIGGVAAVWLGGGVLSIASLVGFIALFGIAARNGILMVTHFERPEAAELPLEHAVVEGSVDRLLPILMTALTAAIALIPIVAAAGEPGSAIQAPLSAVILGGLLSSTVLNLVVVPALYVRFGVQRSRSS